MDLSREVFNNYWGHNIDKEQFCNWIGSREDGFNCYLNQVLQKAYELKDAYMVENLLYVIYLCEDTVILSEHVDILNKLLLCTWHKGHEDTAFLLELIADESSVEYLFQAIHLQPEYLAWDDNFAFEVKCIWGLGMIATEKAKEKLEILKQSKNSIISENAINQLKRMEEKVAIEKLYELYNRYGIDTKCLDALCDESKIKGMRGILIELENKKKKSYEEEDIKIIQELYSMFC